MCRDDSETQLRKRIVRLLKSQLRLRRVSAELFRKTERLGHVQPQMQRLTDHMGARPLGRCCVVEVEDGLQVGHVLGMLVNRREPQQ